MPERPGVVFFGRGWMPERPGVVFFGGGWMPERPGAVFFGGGWMPERPGAVFFGGGWMPERPGVVFSVLNFGETQPLRDMCQVTPTKGRRLHDQGSSSPRALWSVQCRMVIRRL
jgi:hypothetical protein